MTFSQAIQAVFHKYAIFDGRARRSEFWYFMLMNFMASFILSYIGFFIGIPRLSALYSLVVFIPTLAVSWRRLHDVGRSGLWYLLILVPLVGPVMLIIWMAEDSKPGVNEYGPSPKGGNSGSVRRPVSHNSMVSVPVSTQLLVQCISGPLKGQVYPLTPQGMYIGRENNCTIRFSDGTSGISRQHCAIQFQQGVPVLIDLNSTYGTYLANGKKLPPKYPEPVAAGTRFYLGTPINLFQIITPM